MMKTQAGQALIVDTDEGTRVLCRHALEELGFVAEAYDHGARAAHALECAEIDLLLLNPCVPDADAVAPGERCAPPTIILVDGGDVSQGVGRAAWPGVRGVLFKPFAADDLRRVLDEIMPRALVRVYN
jgi:DNA-binding NtrC family response regulator